MQKSAGIVLYFCCSTGRTDRIVESPFMDSNPYGPSLHQRLAATFDWHGLQAPTSACKTVSTQTLNRTVSLLGMLNIDVFGIGNIGSALFQKELRLARGMTFCLQNLVSRFSGALTLFRLGIIHHAAPRFSVLIGFYTYRKWMHSWA